MTSCKVGLRLDEADEVRGGGQSRAALQPQAVLVLSRREHREAVSGVDETLQVSFQL